MNQPLPRKREFQTGAFVLTLIAGLWMLAIGMMSYGFRWHHMRGPMAGGWMWCNGMMGHFAPGFMWPWLGLLAGIVILVGAVMLYTKPEQSSTWGLVIVVAAALNFLFGVGGVLASLLGLVGGALAMSSNKSPPIELDKP